jgi:hypothetical protein
VGRPTEPMEPECCSWAKLVPGQRTQESGSLARERLAGPSKIAEAETEQRNPLPHSWAAGRVQGMVDTLPNLFEQVLERCSEH